MPPPSFREVSPRAWDVYDLVCFLGIDELQTDEVRAGAPLIDRGKAHQKDTNGSYLYPEDHALRSACQFPFFLDRTPRLHQLWAVATYFALAFSGDSRFNKVAHYLIADATGLGKTTMMAMIVTYHVWLKHRLRDDPSFMAPVMAPEKAYLMKGKWKETVSSTAPVRFHPADGIKTIEQVLIVTTHSVLPQIQDELCELLDGEHFIVAGLEKAHKPDEKRHRRQFWNLLGKERVPIVITTWDTLRDEFTQVFDHNIFKSEFKNISLFSSSSPKVIRWGMVFYDEVQTVRNPETAVFRATAALSSVARMAFGTTATPFFNEPLDLLNILRALGTPDGDLRPPRTITLPTSSSVRESTLGSLMKHYNVRAAYWPIVIQCRILENKRNLIQRSIKDLRQQRADNDKTVPLGPNWEFIALPDTHKSQQVQDDWAQWEKGVAELVMEPIAQLAQPFMLRRVLDTKDEDGNSLGCDVDLAITDLSVTLPEAERRRYDRARRKQGMIDPQLPNGFASSVRITLDVHKLLLSSKEATTAEATEEAEEPEELDIDLPTSKVEAVIKIILGIFKTDRALSPSQKRKVLICSAWVEHVPKLVALLAQSGIPTAVMNGKTSDKERTRRTLAFQADQDHPSSHGPSRVLIISPCLQAGLNFFRANILINLDPSWTQAARDQIVGRVHRIGQTRPVQVYNLIVRHSVDEYLASVAARKGRLMEVLDQHACLSPLLVDHEPSALEPSAQASPKRPISESEDDHDNEKVEEGLGHNKRGRPSAEYESD